MFCCKCGKFVARSKHIRLKITSKPCPQKDSTVILHEEGFNRSQNRLDDLFQKLQDDYNATAKHSLEWNRKIGKTIDSPDEGIINCVACNRTWRWKDRQNIRDTKCKAKIAVTCPEKASSSTSRTQTIAPKRRLNSKTSPANAAQPSVSSSDPAQSTSHRENPDDRSSRPGSSRDHELPRVGVG